MFRLWQHGPVITPLPRLRLHARLHVDLQRTASAACR
jgi:hypothetical protein